MRSIEIPELKREQLLAVVAVVLLLVAAQFFIMNMVSVSISEFSASSKEAQILQVALTARSNAVIRYKSSVKIDEKGLPVAIESQSKFYSVLLDLLSAHGFGDADVAKADEREGYISFKVTGEANYNELLRLLSSFRQEAYLIGVSALSLEGLTENNVKYNFTVVGKIGAALKETAEK